MSDDLEQLRSLPVVQADDLHVERVRRLAHAALAPRPKRWSRALLPAVLAVTCCAYFLLALDAAADLYR